MYEFDAFGNIGEFEKKRADINLDMIFVGADGTVIDINGAGIVIDIPNIGLP